MIKFMICIILFSSAMLNSSGQVLNVDSLKRNLQTSHNDTFKLMEMIAITNIYGETNFDSMLLFSQGQLQYAQKLGFPLSQAHAYAGMAYAQLNMARFTEALQNLLAGKKVVMNPVNENNVLPDRYASIESNYDYPKPPEFRRFDTQSLLELEQGILYSNLHDAQKELTHKMEAKAYATRSGNLKLLSTVNLLLAITYSTANKLDSALILGKLAFGQARQAKYKKFIGSILLNLGRIYEKKGDLALAEEYYRAAIVESKLYYQRGEVVGYLWFANLHMHDATNDSSRYFASKALRMAIEIHAPNLELRCDTLLASIFMKAGNKDSIIKYQTQIITLNKSISEPKQTQQVQNIDFNEQQKQEAIEDAKKAYRNRMSTVGLLSAVGVFLLLAVVLLRNNRNANRANILLTAQKLETEHQRNKAEKALSDLKSTQAQLIQSEKMASLGELMAGIAHEIQNPLNFVNNFSEVSHELVDEMKQEFSEQRSNRAMEKADLLKGNLQKILLHGKRADGIVKGMLQHSQAGKGKMEPTAVHPLIGEYLRLAYNSYRAKDKSFQAEIVTHFDQDIDKATFIPQDIGRVVLNICSNAFYSMAEKAGNQPAGYRPTLTVTTEMSDGKMLISIEDNGVGLSESQLHKIFQPFFTTKPTGQGTGLGLSLSYDIIKAHGGEIYAQNTLNGGASFVISLPMA